MTEVVFSKRVVLGDGTSEEPLRVAPAAVTIKGGRIERVEPVASLEARRAEVSQRTDVTLTDFGDRLVAPAFVNGHTHIAMSALRGIEALAAMQGNVVEELYFELEKHLEPDDVRAFARMGAYESLLAGVGSVWDHYYHAKHVALGMQDVGLAGVVAPTLQDQLGPGVGHVETQLEAAIEIDDSDELRSAGIVAALGPHATDTVGDELWNRCFECAEARGFPMHVHVAQSHDEYQRSIAHFAVSPVARLDRLGILDAESGILLVHMMYATDADLDLLRQRRIMLGYCPFSQMQFGFPAHIRAWRAAGIPLTLGTDCGACNDSMSVQGELRILAGGPAFATTFSQAYDEFVEMRSEPRPLQAQTRAAAVRNHRSHAFAETTSFKTPGSLLPAVWAIPGRFHPDMTCGVIEPGAAAHLAVWDLDDPSLWPAREPLRALAMGDTTSALYAIMTAGTWRGETGNVRRSILDDPDYGAARAEADRRLDALLERAGVI